MCIESGVCSNLDLAFPKQVLALLRNLECSTIMRKTRAEVKKKSLQLPSVIYCVDRLKTDCFPPMI